MKNNLLLLLLIFLGSVSVHSQAPSPNYNPILQAPNITSFLKFSDIPVSEYTGLPSIDIPLYNLSVGDVTIPINLRYNGGGIKVEEDASWVGLGWNLDVGGVITKNIVGKEDQPEMQVKYNSAMFLNTELLAVAPYMPVTDAEYLAPFMRLREDMTEEQVEALYADYLANDESGNPMLLWQFRKQFLVTFLAPYRDWKGIFYEKDITDHLVYEEFFRGHYQPDTYSFSFLNYSGKFYIDYRDNTIHVVNDQSNLKFEIIGGNDKYYQNLVGIKATATDGMVFYFTECDRIYDKDIVSYSYFLKRIEYPNGQTVDFTYDQGSLSVSRKVNAPESYTSNITTKIVYARVSSASYHPITVKTITCGNTTVDFVTSAARIDITGDKQLDAIKVKYNGTSLHSIDFKYSNFRSTTGGVDSDVCRLKLLSVSADNNLYKFDYNPLQLPAKNSSSIDHWGYYNGQLNTRIIDGLAKESPMPNFSLLATFDDVYLEIARDYNTFTANRGADPTKSKACILEKVTYPTGGTTQYEWESNTFSNKSYLDATSQKVGYLVNATVSSNGQVLRSQSLDLKEKRSVTISAGISISNALDPNLTQLDMLNMIKGAYVKIFKNGVELYKLDYPTPDLSVSYNNVSIFEPGIYYVEAYMPVTCTARAAGAMIGLSLYERPKWSLGAGLRIAKIVSTPEVGSSKSQRVQIYKYEDGNKSYGVIMSGISYCQKQDLRFSMGGCYTIDRQEVYLSSSNIMSLTNDANGGLVGYDKVDVYDTDMSQYGKVEKYFSNKVAFAGVDMSYMKPPLVPNLKNGKLEKEIFYNKDGSVVKSTVYNYGYITNNFFWGLCGTDSWRGPDHEWCGSTVYEDLAMYPNRFSMLQYAIRSQKWFLQSETTNEFFPSGTATTTKSYEYNSFGLKSKESVVVNSGKKLISSYKYASDYDFNFSIINDGVNTPAENMKVMAEQKYMLSKPVEVLSKAEIDGAEYVTGGDLISYGDKFKPEKVYKLELKDPLLTASFEPSKISGSSFSMSPLYQTEKLKIQYTLNSNVSDIFDYQKGFSTSYLWGYNNIYPIAKIENGSASQVAYTSFEEGVTAGWDVGATLITNYGPTICGKKNCALSGATILSPVLQPGTYWVDLQVSSMGAGKLSINGSYPYSTSGTTAPFRAQCTISVAGRISINGDAGSGMFIDEVRIYPVDAQMSTYTYDPLVGMTSQTDPNGTVTRYEYDSFGRLLRIKDTNGNILKEMEYNYAH